MKSSVLVQFSAVCLIGALAVKQDQMPQVSGSDLSFLSSEQETGSDLSFLSGEQENQVTDEKAM